MKKIKLKGACVGIATRPKGYSKKAMEEAVVKAGGVLSTKAKPHKDLDILLCGTEGPDGRINQAMAHGSTIVQGEAVVELLEHGVVEIDEEAGKKTFDQLIGPIRALLSAELTPDKWTSLTGFVDQCLAKEMQKLLAYLKPQLDARSVRHEERPLVYNFDHGELRPFPPLWLVAASVGETHPKFELCNTITFTEAWIGSTLAAKVFDQDALSHVTMFDTGDVNEEHMKKKSFYKKMAKAKNMHNVRKLVLGSDWDNAYLELLKATSLTNLEEIWLRNSLWMDTANSGGDIYFGPWANQLTTVGASKTQHLHAIKERLDELPSLNHVAVHLAYIINQERMLSMIDAISSILPRIKRLSLFTTQTHSTYIHHDGLGELFDGISHQKLEVLDLRSCPHTKLEGELGEFFVQKHFIENGFASNLKQLIIHEHITPKLCTLLRDHGVDVITPVSVDLQATLPRFQYIEEEPQGTLERHDKHLVHPHEAMMFDEPCAEAWRVVVGVVNRLETQLDPKEFASAIKEISSHLDQWPDEHRELPVEWLQALHDEDPSPKLDLVRRLSLSLSYGRFTTDMKCASRWFTRLSQAPHINRISILGIEGYGSQKHLHQSLLALVKAMRPDTIELSTLDKHADALCDLLQTHDVLPERREPSYTPWKKATPRTAIDTYKSRHVVHKISTIEMLQDVLALEDLDHVVSLDIELDQYGNFPSTTKVSSFKIATARLSSLKYLRVWMPSHMKVLFRGVFPQWLKLARPIHLTHPVETLDATINAGIYERTFGSTVTFASDLNIEDLKACVANERFHASHLVFPTERTSEGTPITEIVESMHEGLRAQIRSLSVGVELKEWSNMGDVCTRLPNLSTLVCINQAFENPLGRLPYLDAFKEMHPLHKLARVRVLAKYVRKNNPLNAQEVKSLQNANCAGVLCLG